MNGLKGLLTLKVKEFLVPATSASASQSEQSPLPSRDLVREHGQSPMEAGISIQTIVVANGRITRWADPTPSTMRYE